MITAAITSAGTLGRPRPVATRREQVREQLVGEQLSPMRGQKLKHAARLKQMPRYRLRSEQLTLIIRSPLHTTIIPNNQVGRLDWRPIEPVMVRGRGWRCRSNRLFGRWPEVERLQATLASAYDG